MQANKCPLSMPYRSTVCLRPERQIDALSGILRRPFSKSPLTPLGISKEGRFVFHAAELHEHPYRVASALASTTADLRAAAS
jgi:hypothetical protein